jgi:Papain family cysteine protease
MKKASIVLITLTIALFGCDKDEPTTDNPTNGGTGLKKNSEAALNKVEEADFDEDIFQTPAKFILNGPPIIDQGQTSKCVAFSAGYYITSMYNGVTSTNLDKSGSPEFLYAQYKKINNDNNCSEGCLLFNEGSTIGAGEILRQYGTTSWNQLPFVEANTCSVLNSTLNTQAANNRVKDFYRLSPKESQNVAELKSWLYAGFPLWIGVDIDAGFQALKANEVWDSAEGKSEGGHAMVIVGYDDAKKAFKIANSWGTDWADGGYGWADYTYFTTKILALKDAEIGVLIPNDAQRINMGTVSPVACGTLGWGDIVINNNRAQEIAIEITGANNYNNNDAENIDASEGQMFTGIPKGTVKVKVFTANKATLIREYDVTVTQCKEVELNVN